MLAGTWAGGGLPATHPRKSPPGDEAGGPVKGGNPSKLGSIRMPGVSPDINALGYVRAASIIRCHISVGILLSS
jgi:hypothetical protein